VRRPGALTLGTPRNTYFFSTESITRLEWQNRRGHRVSQEELDEMFPDHDLYSIGILLKDATMHTRLMRDLATELGEAGLSALEKIRDGLLEPIGRGPYRSLAHLRSDWRKLDRRYLSPLGIPELSVAANVKTSVVTPLGRIPITDRIYEVINHPLFQRLRDIPQLEFCYLLYPGANHSRLHHSLTCFDTARQFVAQLLNDPSFRLMVEPSQIEATLLWALLHDVGHYPLSHMFEDSSAERRDEQVGRIPDDEDLFWPLINPEFAEEWLWPFADAATETIKEASVIPIEPIADLLKRVFGEGVLEALRAIDDANTPSDRVLKGLISSAVDVDKVAYLQDDSAMSGVRYGAGIDTDGLISSLVAPQPEDLQKPEPVLAITDKGLPAAESVVLARYWMLKRVYWHHTNRAIMAMVKFVVNQLLAAEVLTMESYIRKTFFMTPIETLRFLSAEFDRAVKDSVLSFDNPPHNPLPGLLPGNRYLYKRLLTVALGPLDADRRLYERLAYKRSHEIEDLIDDLIPIVKQYLPKARKIRHGEILIDVPFKRREDPGGEIGSSVYVYFRDDPQTGRHLYSSDAPASPLLASHRAEFERHVKKCRVFVHPLLFDELKPSHADVKKALKETLTPK
jgi:HD superfamily phosphohydrolase